jgi:beta-N-acetylglucosaminidase/flagellar biosynthesis chaperone FliJ
MRMSSPWLARHRVHVALPVLVGLTLLAQPVAADNNPQADVNNAQRNLQNAQQNAQNALQNAQNALSHASAQDRALAAAQAQLSAITAQLTALDQRITALDATIATDTATVDHLDAQLQGDRDRLAAYVRQAYENGGSEAALVYIISAQDIPTAIERKEQEDHVATAVQDLIDRIHSEETQARQTLDADNAARAQLAVAEQQARTTQVLETVQEEQVSAADAAAHQTANQAQAALTAAKSQLTAAQKELAAKEAALAAARASGVVYSPVPGSQFSIDTDLRLPSGETAARLNSFLQGTDLAGLGGSFMQAEQAFHVSARYFVAHAILESDWGSSAIAQNKHNLFGFGADDANPYQDAKTFPSFDACIQYVAQFIEVNYLTPGGQYYHGPTLRGMNVDYASDPDWAEKIASIAQTIP